MYLSQTLCFSKLNVTSNKYCKNLKKSSIDLVKTKRTFLKIIKLKDSIKNITIKK